MNDDGQRVNVLKSLLPMLPEEQKGAISFEATKAAQAIVRDDNRARALSELLPSLAGSERIRALTILLQSCLGEGVQMRIAGTDIQRNLDRPFLLEEISKVARVLADIGGETVVEEAAHAILDTAAWWP
jgi:hypothetical protein